jgi:hypothetical protein
VDCGHEGQYLVVYNGTSVLVRGAFGADTYYIFLWVMS